MKLSAHGAGLPGTEFLYRPLGKGKHGRRNVRVTDAEETPVPGEGAPVAAGAAACPTLGEKPVQRTVLMFLLTTIQEIFEKCLTK